MLAGSLYKGINARHAAEKWLKPKWSKKELPVSNANSTHPHSEEPEYVSRAEFALVDNLRIIAFLSMLASAFIMGLGKKGLRSTWRLNASKSAKTFKRSMVRTLFLFMLGLIIRHYVKDSIHIVKKHNGHDHHKPHHKRGGHPHRHERKLEGLYGEDEEMPMFEVDW